MPPVQPPCALESSRQTMRGTGANKPPFFDALRVPKYEFRPREGESADSRDNDALRRNSKVFTAHSSVCGIIRWTGEVRFGSRHPLRRFSNDPFLFGRRTSAKHAPDYQSNHSGQGSTCFHGGERTNRRFGCNYRRLRMDYESKAVRKRFCAKCEARL